MIYSVCSLRVTEHKVFLMSHLIKVLEIMHRSCLQNEGGFDISSLFSIVNIGSHLRPSSEYHLPRHCLRFEQDCEGTVTNNRTHTLIKLRLDSFAHYKWSSSIRIHPSPESGNSLSFRYAIPLAKNDDEHLRQRVLQPTLPLPLILFRPPLCSYQHLVRR